MENINRKETPDSPSIVFDSKANKLTIVGNSFPETSEKVYLPLKKFFEEYDINSYPNLTIEFQFNLINSTSVVYLAQVMIKIGGLVQKGLDLSVNWIYDSYDDEMLDLGKKLSSVSKVDFNYVSLDSDDEDVI